MSGAPPRLPWPPDLLREPRPSRAGTWLFVLALAVLVAWDLGGRSMHHRDQTRFGVIASEMLRSGDWLVPTQHGRTYANKPILYIWAVAAPSALVGGVTAFLLRLPSALALLATALSAAAWGRARSGSVAVGRLAALFTATTWLLFELGRTGRPDMLATGFATAGAMWTDRAILGRGRRRDPLFAGLALGGGLLSKGPVALLPALVLLLVPRRDLPFRERARRARPGVVLGATLAVAALWAVPAFLHGGTEFARRLLVDQTAERLSGQANHLEAWWYYLPAFPQSALPWSPLYVGVLLMLASRRARALFADGAHVVAAAVCLLVLSAVPTKEVRYATILVPPLAVAAAQVVSALADRARDASRWSRPLRVLGLVSLAGTGVGVWIAARAPSSLPWALPPLLALAAGGVGAVRSAPAPGEPARRSIGRIAGLSVLLAVATLLLYWTVLPRREPIESVKENRAVAAVLPPGVPVVVVGGVAGGLDPDRVFESAPDADFAREPSAIPGRDTVPDLVVLCLEEQVEAVAAARGESPTRLLARPRRGDPEHALVVLRFGGPR